MESKNKAFVEQKITIEEEIASLQTQFRQLKTQYELFFSRVLPRPPVEIRSRMNKAVRVLGERRDMKIAQRFSYNNFVHRWNTFSELWNRRMQKHEEGARTNPIQRRRQIAEALTAPPPPPPAARNPAAGLVARTAVRDLTDAGGEEMKSFYRAFVEARREAGAEKPLSYERFCQEIGKHVDTIRKKSSCDRVDFRLYLKDNKVSLKAKPLREEENPS